MPATRPLIISSDIGRLQGKINSSCWAVGLIRAHNLFAEQKPRMAREFDPSLRSKADGRPVDDHELALAKLKHQICHHQDPMPAHHFGEPARRILQRDEQIVNNSTDQALGDVDKPGPNSDGRKLNEAQKAIG